MACASAVAQVMIDQSDVRVKKLQKSLLEFKYGAKDVLMQGGVWLVQYVDGRYGYFLCKVLAFLNDALDLRVLSQFLNFRGFFVIV